MGYEQITTETRGDVLLLTLNRPEKLNAVDRRESGSRVAAAARPGAQKLHRVEHDVCRPID